MLAQVSGAIDGKLLQVGSDATTGRGLVSARVLPAPAPEARRDPMNTTAKTAPVTLEQQRAQFAWDCARKARPSPVDDYRQPRQDRSGIIIMNNGLMQTLAFYQDKGKPHHMTLAGQLRRWIMKRIRGQQPGPRVSLNDGSAAACPTRPIPRATDSPC